jgi:hypothetical protein
MALLAEQHVPGGGGTGGTGEAGDLVQGAKRSLTCLHIHIQWVSYHYYVLKTGPKVDDVARGGGNLVKCITYVNDMLMLTLCANVVRSVRPCGF